MIVGIMVDNELYLKRTGRQPLGKAPGAEAEELFDPHSHWNSGFLVHRDAVESTLGLLRPLFPPSASQFLWQGACCLGWNRNC